MDLFSEASSETRVLAARHISEKMYHETNNAINTTLLCYNYSLQPDIDSYKTALGNYAVLIWTCGAGALVATCLLYAVTMLAAYKHWRFCILNVAVILAVYPIVTLTSLITIVIPRTFLLCEAIAQQAVVIALYHFFCMIIAECGGPDKLVRLAGECRLQTRVLPCCCWPCCVIPRPKIHTRYLTWIRCIILQMPVIQAIIYFIILVLWAEDLTLYLNNFIYIQPLVAASLLLGMWGIIMCVRTVESLGIKSRPRFVAVQLVLLIIKVQIGITRTMSSFFDLPCVMTLHPSVFVNLIQNCVIILEMLLLSIWAWRLYSVPPGKVIDRVQHAVAAVADDSFVTYDETMIRKGIENKSFKLMNDLI